MSEQNKTERQWTRGQSAAISIRGKTLLVSAAAGSGKTATLTERIIRTLTEDEDSDISKMLIVTFTRAAATELRDRIFKALSEKLATDPQNRRLNEQLIKLGSASICTIDAFYLTLIRQNFTALGISASARIADTSELDVLTKSVMEEVIDKFYDSDPDFPLFAECFIRTKSVYMLSNTMLDTYSELSSSPDGIELLKKQADALLSYAESKTDFFDTPYGIALRRVLIPKFEYYSRVLEDARINAEQNSDIIGKRIPCYVYEEEFSKRVYSALCESADFGKLHDLFSSYSPPRMGSITRGEQDDEEGLFYKDTRAQIKDDIISLKDKIFGRSTETLAEEMRLTAGHTDMLYRVLSEFFDKLSEEKLRRNIMDFDDIKRYTYKLLVNPDRTPTELAKQYQKQFSDIYIDEYQDVDLVQDLIFSAISRNNRFMVGDIKQSIYGFRGAEPKVFASYKERFYSLDTDNESAPPEGINEATIFMSENFRCDPNVIKFTNLVCSRIFGATADSIGYTSADDLRFSKFPPVDDRKAEVTVILTDSSDDENEENENEAEPPKKKRRKRNSVSTPDKEEYEAEYIADKIESLIGKETLANGRLITPGDIAILYRSGKMVAYLSEALARRGILCSEGGGGSYFESPDVLLVLSLLNAVDNPHRDIHLAAVLCSPLYEFSLDELISIRKSVPHTFSLYDALLDRSNTDDELGRKCLGFERELSGLRASSLSLPVDRFLRLLFESDIFAASGLLADRDSFGEGGNLLRLYDYARTFEASSFKGLYNFIEFINDLIENDKMLEIAPKERCAERVTLTTMHHSKGLEFPVCFICGVGAKKNMRQLNGSILYDEAIGVAMKLSDKTGFSRTNTPMREAIAKAKYIDEIEEEMRILYVALTRARERLYITAAKKADPESLLFNAKMRSRYSCRYTVTSCTSFLDWLLIPFADESADLSSCTLRFVTPQSPVASDGGSEKISDGSERAPRPAPDTQLLERLREKFDYSYGYSALTRIPAKLSISKLYPDILDEVNSSAELIEDKKTQIPDFFISGKTHSVSSADRGTATHLFLQFCNLPRARATGVSEEIARLIEKRFIPENIADIIYVDELERFIDSPLAHKMLSASRIIREQRFNLLLDAAAFTESREFAELLTNETLAVQGVIDLILIDENGDIELYDYKTDRLTARELADPTEAKRRLNSSHALQLSYYAHAIEQLFGRRCKKVCIYSTHSAELYDVELVPLSLTKK